MTLSGLKVQILLAFSKPKTLNFHEKSQKKVKNWSLPFSNSCNVAIKLYENLYNTKIVRNTILLLFLSLFPNFCYLGPVWGAILVMNHDLMVQILARNLFPRKYFHFSGFHAHNAIACVFFRQKRLRRAKTFICLIFDLWF